jgi:hypothetical protein
VTFRIAFPHAEKAGDSGDKVKASQSGAGARARGRALRGFAYLRCASSAKGRARTSTLSRSAPAPNPASPNPVSPGAPLAPSGRASTDPTPTMPPYPWPRPLSGTSQTSPRLPMRRASAAEATRTAACREKCCPHCASHPLGVAARRTVPNRPCHRPQRRREISSKWASALLPPPADAPGRRSGDRSRVSRLAMCVFVSHLAMCCREKGCLRQRATTVYSAGKPSRVCVYARAVCACAQQTPQQQSCKSAYAM